MPYTVSNTFSPLTPVGEAIQNVTRLMFSGPTQAERDKAGLNAAHADYYRAQTDAIRNKALAEEQARRDLADAPRRMVGAMFGNQQGADTWMAARQTGAQPLAGFNFSGGDAGPSPDPGAQGPAAVPLQVDPAAAARAARLLTGVEAAKALPGSDNLGAMAKFLPALMGDELRQGAISGAPLTLGQYANVGRSTAAVEGRPIFNNLGKEGVFDVFGGGQTLNGIGEADVALKGEQGKTEKSKQNENNAQAGAATATRDLRRAQTSEIGRLKPVTDPATGEVYMAPEGKVALAILGRENKKDIQDNKDANRAPGAGKPPIKVDPKVLDAELNRLTNAGPERVIDPGFSNAVRSRATALAQDANGEFYGKPIAAVQAALTELAGGQELVDHTGSWRDVNKRYAAPGWKPGTAAPSAPAAPAAGGGKVRIRFDAQGNPVP